MMTYVLRRLTFLGLTVIVTSLVIFIVTQMLPGDVARVVLGREAGEEALAAFRETHGLNDPLPVQYSRWLANFAKGEWGTSLSARSDIYPLVMERLKNSLLLASITMLIAVPLAIFLGILAGLHEDELTDSTISIASLAVVGLPEFVTGLVLIQIFSRWLGWFPANSSIEPGATFAEKWPMLILPAMTATMVLLAYIIRLTRAGIIEELGQPYVRTATLKGLPRRTIITKHVLRNALLPTITVIAVSFGWLISGLIVIENVFNYPGLGRLLTFAIDRRDLPLVQAIAMITVVGFGLANLAADLIYAWLNPRIRLN